MTPTSEQFHDATWDEILPLYTALEQRDLTDDAAIESWPAEWNALDTAIMDADQRAYVANSCDSEDADKEAVSLRFQSEIMPNLSAARTRLAEKLLATGYQRDDLDEVMRRWRTDRDLFREENLPIRARLAELSNAYFRITGSMRVEWDSEVVPTSALAAYLNDGDREVRERAFRTMFAPYVAHRDDLADIFDEMIDLRQQLARNSGFANYRDYMFAELYRFDYTPEDCLAFHDAIEQVFVPIIRELREDRKARMGVEPFRPWDWSGDPEGRPALHPFDSTDELVSRTEQVLAQVAPTFGEMFHDMATHDLLDLETRTGKHPGGYCTDFAETGQPFIFMNHNGSAQDVSTLLHESGHSFQSYLTAELPFVWQRMPGMEFAEVASMSMELKASGFLGKESGGFYDAADHRRALLDHLTGELEAMRLYAIIDAFQHWIYTDPAGRDRDARDAKFAEIFQRFDPVTDWSGIEELLHNRWTRTLHIFEVPFYFIEYDIAWLGAVQVWKRFRKDPQTATDDYRAALALGGSRPLPDLYARAGIRLIFDRDGMQEIADFVRERIAELTVE